MALFWNSWKVSPRIRTVQYFELIYHYKLTNNQNTKDIDYCEPGHGFFHLYNLQDP